MRRAQYQENLRSLSRVHDVADSGLMPVVHWKIRLNVGRCVGQDLDLQQLAQQ
jgi:hypothetical protein